MEYSLTTTYLAMTFARPAASSQTLSSDAPSKPYSNVVGCCR
jgi:hypothetical protein